MNFILELKENLRQVDINLGFDVDWITNFTGYFKYMLSALTRIHFIVWSIYV